MLINSNKTNIPLLINVHNYIRICCHKRQAESSAHAGIDGRYPVLRAKAPGIVCLIPEVESSVPDKVRAVRALPFLQLQHVETPEKWNKLRICVTNPCGRLPCRRTLSGWSCCRLRCRRKRWSCSGCGCLHGSAGSTHRSSTVQAPQQQGGLYHS